MIDDLSMAAWRLDHAAVHDAEDEHCGAPATLYAAGMTYCRACFQSALNYGRMHMPETFEEDR